MSENKVEILCQNPRKVFGPNPGSVLAAVNNGVTKQEAPRQRILRPLRA